MVPLPIREEGNKYFLQQLPAIDTQAKGNEVTLRYRKQFLQIAPNILINQEKGMYEEEFHVFNIDIFLSCAFDCDSVLVKIDN